MAAQGINEVAVELYAVHPTKFMAARAEQVRRAREAGNRDLAVAVGRLRRPTVSAWAVNLLVRNAGGQVSELLTLGEQLRAAHQQLRGEQLRRLNQRRQEVIGKLARQAQQFAANAGHPLGSTALGEVEQTLAAALADPNSAEAVRVGHLTRPLRHIGLGAEPYVGTPRPTSRAPGPDAPGISTAEAAAGAAGAGEGLQAPLPPLPVESFLVEQSREGELARPGQRPGERLAQNLARAHQELDEATAQVERAEQELRVATEQSAAAERRLAELRQERDRWEQERADALHRAQSAARLRDEARIRVQQLIAEQRAAQ